VENREYERGGRLNVKIHFSLKRQLMNSCTWTDEKIKCVDILGSVICIIMLLAKYVNMAMVRNVEIMLEQTLNHCM
jgi:hypothetical protein